MSIRPATESDIDAITWISVAATPADPVCPYRYPLREKFPEDFENFSRIRLGEYYAGAVSGASDFLVFESPSLEDPNIKKVVAFSIWDMPTTVASRRGNKQNAPETIPQHATEKEKPAKQKPADHLERRDAHPARMAAYRADINRAKKDLFDNKYGDQHYYLGLLATHPSYQGRGAGRALVEWGLEKAQRMGWTVSLFSSPMGKRVYEKVGFKDVGSFRTRVEGEEEFLDTPGMVLEAGSW